MNERKGKKQHMWDLLAPEFSFLSDIAATSLTLFFETGVLLKSRQSRSNKKSEREGKWEHFSPVCSPQASSFSFSFLRIRQSSNFLL